MIAFAKKAKASVGNWVTKHLKLWLNVLREFFLVPVVSLDEPKAKLLNLPVGKSAFGIKSAKPDWVGGELTETYMVLLEK